LIHLLISSAGRRVELINCFRSAAKGLALGLEIVAIDAAPDWSPACQIADHSHRVPICTEANFVDAVVNICDSHQVDLIIPTIDTELIVYAENRSRFIECGTEILVSEPEMVSVARDKQATAQLLTKHGIITPKTWNLEKCLTSNTSLSFPLMLKPRDGSGSAEITVVESMDALERIQGDLSRYILQELCQGDEFTVNAFYNREGQCVACVPHIRHLVRDGEVCFAETKRIPQFKSVADKLAFIFHGMWGTICFQGFMGNDGTVQIFEINARFGGGYPICDKAGGTFAKWILQDLCGQDPDYHDNWKDGVRMLRYDAAVFI
jgi:carbamoyl-phosphate synthase large subunit